ncbi:MAG: type II secretion system F family protein [Bacillota bacterium]
MNGYGILLAIPAGIAAFAAGCLWNDALATRVVNSAAAHLETPVRRVRGILRREKKERRDLDRQVLDWMDMLYVAACCGLNLHDAVSRTAPMVDEELAGVLRRGLSRYAAGDSLLDVLAEELAEAGEVAGEVAWLLRDSVRDGLPLASALSDLRGHLMRKRRADIGAHLRTLGLRITLVTVFLLFPPAFVLIVLPNVLAFVSM